MTTKELVLNALSNSINTPVSGQALAVSCKVSRTAIWKAINSLREEGCQIEGTTNGGYLLKETPDILNTQTFASQFGKDFPEFSGLHCQCFKTIDSTNTYAKKILTQDGTGFLTRIEKSKGAFAVIIAESQTAGRGRLGRTFVSPQKTGLYLSIIYSPDGGISNPAILTTASAVAVCRAIKKLYNKETSIKWINDIFLNNKKICGILTEGFTNFETGAIDSAIIGIGININQNTKDFSEELLKTAGSICNDKTDSATRTQLASLVTGEVINILNQEQDSIISEYKSRSFLIGKEVEVHPVIGDTSKIYKAKVLDINSEANLVVQSQDGEIKNLSSGEVSLKSDLFTSDKNSSGS